MEEDFKKVDVFGSRAAKVKRMSEREQVREQSLTERLLPLLLLEGYNLPYDERHHASKLAAYMTEVSLPLEALRN